MVNMKVVLTLLFVVVIGQHLSLFYFLSRQSYFLSLLSRDLFQLTKSFSPEARMSDKQLLSQFVQL